MNPVFEVLAFRDGCKMLELKTTAFSTPAIIGNLTALQTLNLQDCRSLASLKLRSLTSIPEAIGGLTALETQYLYCCDSLTSLPESIGGLTALQTLYLD